MVLYFAAMLTIGFIYSKRSNSSTKQYFAGGRGVGPWLTALSAEASDMSGWLLMGLPGVAYFTGAADPMWTAIGLALGTYLNWKLVARRLRRYSVVAGDAITIPDFFSSASMTIAISYPPSLRSSSSYSSACTSAAAS